MIKIVAAAVWIAAVTVGSVFYAFQNAGDTAEAAPEAAGPGGLDYVRTDVVSVPILKSGQVEGYFLARLVYTGAADKLKALPLPAEIVLVDEVYSYLYGNPQIDFTRHDELDVDAFREGIRQNLNQRLGEDLIDEVLIEQLDFLSKADIRRNSIRGWDTATQEKPEPEPIAAAEH